jgi:hypothetical protein
MIPAQRGRAVVALVLLAGCAPTYQPATLSTLAPRSRLTLTDSSRVEVTLPEVRGDSLHSDSLPAIPVARIARVEAERATSPDDVLGIVAGAVLGFGVFLLVRDRTEQ